MRSVLAAAVLLALAAPAAAHDPYFHWKDQNGTSCCHRVDCGVWDAEDVQPARDGAFRVLSLGVTVPREKVLPSPDGRTHVCCVREDQRIDGPCKRWRDGSFTVRCVSVPMGM